jgi:hypothetical protein
LDPYLTYTKIYKLKLQGFRRKYRDKSSSPPIGNGFLDKTPKCSNHKRKKQMYQTSSKKKSASKDTTNKVKRNHRTGYDVCKSYT